MDEQFGSETLRDAARNGSPIAFTEEKSGQEEFDFEYSEKFARHIEAFNPTFAKVLVRYNPEGDTALNQRQAHRLSRLMLTGGICENLLPIRARICAAGPLAWPGSR